MRYRHVLAVLLASLSAGVQAQETPAPAAAPAPGASESYLGLRLGAVIPQHSDLDGFENGFAFDVFIGRRFHPNFALEGSVGRFAMSATATQYDPSIGTYTVTAEMVAIPVVVSLKAIYPAQSIELYGDVGAGLYFMTFTGMPTSPASARCTSRTPTTRSPSTSAAESRGGSPRR